MSRNAAHVFSASLLLATFVYACSPDFRSFQLANMHRPCTQCKEIYTTNTCTNEFHNSSSKCVTPKIDYTISIGPSPCGHAVITCASFPDTLSSTVIVAKLAQTSNSTGLSYGAVSSMQSPNAHLFLRCDSESQWLTTDLESNELEQPLVVQCAQVQEDNVMTLLLNSNV